MEVKFNVTDTRAMPIVKGVVAATKTYVNGNAIKDGYKLTWSNPPFKGIMTPGIELRVYIGNNEPSSEIYYWIDCPSQMDRLFIPIAEWDILKGKLLSAGYTKATIFINYRLNVTDANFKSTYTNRGRSDPITVLLK